MILTRPIPTLPDPAQAETTRASELAVSLRECAVETLPAGERRFRALIENCRDAVVLLSPEGTVLYASPAVSRILGCAPEMIVGRNVFDGIHPDDEPGAREVLGDILQTPGARATCEYRRLHADGSWRWIESCVTNLLHEPSVQALVQNARDVTPRKRAEEELRAARERLQHLISATSTVIFSCRPSPDYETTYLSGNVRALSGLDASAFLGNSRFWSDCVHPEDAARVQAELTTLAECGRVSHEYRFLHQNGAHRWVRNELRLLRDDGGEPVEIVGSLIDVTERRQAEAALRSSEEQLRQSQKMEAVGRLAGGVAHDFNNMLAAITGYGDLLLHRSDLDETARGFVQEIMKAADRASSLTRQLLMFSRKQVLALQVLDLNEIVTNMHKMLRRLIGEDIELVTVFDPNAGRVRADPVQIEQVILNLAVNARDAMPQGGKLTIEICNTEMDETHTWRLPDAKPGPYVKLTVADTGCGMDAELQSHIFEPFFTTKEQGKGTGLGLPTVFGIVRQSGGHIWVDSEPGQGSVFAIYLPRVVDSARVEANSALAERPATGSETILLVEDEPIVRGLVAEVLRTSGYTVLEAIQGDDALRVCAQHPGPIELLLTDVVMPGMSGRELAERVTAERPDTEVLFMSGYTDDAVVRHGVLDADIHLIQKPFTPLVLMQKVREVLGSCD